MAKKRSKRRRKSTSEKRRRRVPPARGEHVEAKGAFAGTAFQSSGFQTPPPAPLTIAPTPYLSDPAAELPIGEYLRVDLASPAFKEFNAKLKQIFAELQRSNIIAGETRDRISAELEAGRTLLVAPKPSRDLVDLLLVRPLKYLATAAVGADTLMSALVKSGRGAVKSRCLLYPQ
jgi:hypothetical protein